MFYFQTYELVGISSTLFVFKFGIFDLKHRMKTVDGFI